jgi:hypothetical protein
LVRPWKSIPGRINNTTTTTQQQHFTFTSHFTSFPKFAQQQTKSVVNIQPVFAGLSTTFFGVFLQRCHTFFFLFPKRSFAFLVLKFERIMLSSCVVVVIKQLKCQVGGTVSLLTHSFWLM